jgi:hypothetical protein
MGVILLDIGIKFGSLDLDFINQRLCQGILHKPNMTKSPNIMPKQPIHMTKMRIRPGQNPKRTRQNPDVTLPNCQSGGKHWQRNSKIGQ